MDGPDRTVMLERRGARLCALERGTGLPVLFAHGLGGSAAQAEEAFPDRPGFRRLTPEWRGHGASGAGTERPFSIPMLAADAMAMADVVGFDTFVAGGVSMGAAVALYLAVVHPARIRALILVRPAWLFDPAPPYMLALQEIAAFLRALPADQAKAAFARSATGLRLAREAPDNLRALLGFFDRPEPGVTADLCADVARGDPGVSRDQAAALRVPTLVIGHDRDHAHPLAYAKAVAATIPGSMFSEVPPRTGGKAVSLQATRHAIAAFLHGLAVEG